MTWKIFVKCESSSNGRAAWQVSRRQGNGAMDTPKRTGESLHSIVERSLLMPMQTTCNCVTAALIRTEGIMSEPPSANHFVRALLRLIRLQPVLKLFCSHGSHETGIFENNLRFVQKLLYKELFSLYNRFHGQFWAPAHTNARSFEMLKRIKSMLGKAFGLMFSVSAKDTATSLSVPQVAKSTEPAAKPRKPGRRETGEIWRSFSAKERRGRPGILH